MGEPNFTNMASHSPLLLILGLALCCGMCTAYRHHDPYLHELHQTQAELKITQLELSRERALNDLLRHQSSLHSAPSPAPAPQDAAPKTTSQPPPQQPPPQHHRRGCLLCEIVSSLAGLSIIGGLVRLATGGCSRPSAPPQCVGFWLLRLVGIFAGVHFLLSVLSSLSWSACFLTSMLLVKIPVFFFLLPTLTAAFCSRSEPQQPAASSWRPCSWFRSSTTGAVPRGQTLPAPPLARGTRGPGVAQLQHCLIELGHMQSSAIRFCAGVYGPRTAEAVAKVQQAMQLQPTGEYDAAVHDALSRQLAAKATDQATATADAGNAQASVRLPSPPATALAKTTVTEDDGNTTEPTSKADSAVDDSNADAWVPVPPPHATPEQRQQHPAEMSGNKQRLIEMGFCDVDIDNALAATDGSLEQATAWLAYHTQDGAPQFPAEWEALVKDLEQMGFEHAVAKAALIETDGKVKDAVKVLVTAERAKAS